MKSWYCCPICGQKLVMVDKTKHFEGVYTKCKKCKSEVEIKNKSEK